MVEEVAVPATSSIAATARLREIGDDDRPAVHMNEPLRLQAAQVAGHSSSLKVGLGQSKNAVQSNAPKITAWVSSAKPSL